MNRPDQSEGPIPQLTTTELWASTLVRLVDRLRWPIAIVISVFILGETVPYLAGRETEIRVGLSWIQDLGEGFGLKLSVAINALLGFFWYTSHKTQRKTIARLGQRNTRNELLIDQSRTSSGLALDGTTNPDDR